MATFAKYVAPQVQRTDWSAITRDLSSGLQEVYRDREAQKAELDKLEMDAATEVNNTEMGKSQTFNEFTLKGINTTKDYMASQNKLLKQGLITPAQYKLNILRAQEGWQTFAKNAETFNQDYADFLDRLDKGEASSLEEFARENYLSLTDLTNKQIYVNPVDGNVYIAKVDPSNGQVITDGLMDVKTINNALNQKITKIDLPLAVNDYVKLYGKYGGVDPETGKYVIAGIDLNEKDKIISSTTDAVLANNKAVASVLLDNASGYRAVSPEQYKGLTPEQKRTAIVVKPNAQGVFTPEITDELMADAREVVKQAIMAQIDYKGKDPEEQRRYEEQLKLQRAAAYRARGGGGGGGSGKKITKADIDKRARNIGKFLEDPTDPNSLKMIRGATVPGYGTLETVTKQYGGDYKVTFKRREGEKVIPYTETFSLPELTNIYNEAANAGAESAEYKISLEQVQDLIPNYTNPTWFPSTQPPANDNPFVPNFNFDFDNF